MEETQWLAEVGPGGIIPRTILHSACVINIDQKFFTEMLLSGMSLEEPGESGQSAAAEAVVETRKM